MGRFFDEFPPPPPISGRHAGGIFVVVVLAALATGAMHAVDQTNRFTKERFTAFAVNTETWLTQSGTVEIVVTGWSTDADRNRLTALLFDRGPEAVLDALRKARTVGYIRTPDSIGYDLHFAREVPGEDGGRRIILVTDRPVGFWEAPALTDYPFTLIELRLNRDGDGEGKMSIATRIIGNKAFNLIELEDYATQPVRLMSVRSVRAPTS